MVLAMESMTDFLLNKYKEIILSVFEQISPNKIL